MGANQSQSEAESERIPGFLYLDMNRVKSISSRLDEGYIESTVEEQEESTEIAARLTAGVKAALLGVGGASAQASTEGRRAEMERVEESKALHHYSYTLLEQWLQENEDEWFHDIDTYLEDFDDRSYSENAAPSAIREEVSEGDIIRVSGKIDMLDFDTSFEFIDGILNGLREMNERIEEVTRNIDVSEEDIQEMSGVSTSELNAYESVFGLMRRVMPQQYTNLIAANVYPVEHNKDLTFWALIQSDSLESNPVEMLSKYQNSSIPNCTVLARVESITEREDDEQEIDVENIDLGTLHHLSDNVAANYGFKVSYPAISISPIAIYR